MFIPVRTLLWDPWNVEHIAIRGVVQQEVEEVCHGSPIAYETYGGRFLLVGPAADGNLLSVVLAPKYEQGEYYVVTARSASKRERRNYRERTGTAQ